MGQDGALLGFLERMASSLAGRAKRSYYDRAVNLVSSLVWSGLAVVLVVDLVVAELDIMERNSLRAFPSVPWYTVSRADMIT